ncbi:MAG: hypothetical protein J0H23_14195 [Micrococcales bacterium]|nr:hypothetical protein [Micrococcales bacterium]OJX68962.1 MAG: hypothetical protein BGO94_10230 [Micrococcales bacterium 72-143]
MSLYADFGPRRTAQIVADVVAVVVIVVSVALGVAVHNAIAVLGGVWAQLEDAGSGFEDTMGEIGETLGGVPLIGGGIRGPFDTAAGAGGTLADAGRTGQAAVETLATIAGLGVAFLPIAIVLIVWLWPRIRFARRSAETRAILRLEDGRLLLALRALDDARASELARISPRALSDWRAGTPSVVHALAALEAREAGVRLPEHVATTA